jgi:hypothetical protein
MLGSIDLSRGVAVGPSVVWLEHAVLLMALTVLAFLAGVLVRRRFGLMTRLLAAGFVVGLVAAYATAALLASVVIGEIELRDGPTVTAVISGLGLWPLAALAGLTLRVGRPGIA